MHCQCHKILTVLKGTWSGIKVNCVARLRNKKMMPWVLIEFMWHRKHHGDLWDGLMKMLKYIVQELPEIRHTLLVFSRL